MRAQLLSKKTPFDIFVSCMPHIPFPYPCFIHAYACGSIQGINANSVRPYARILLLPVVHLSFLSPPPLPLMASCPQLPPANPISPSRRPISFPQAYPAPKEMAENTSTTPAEIIQAVNVGLIVSSPCAMAFVGRIFFAWRSLLVSRDLLLTAFGDLGPPIPIPVSAAEQSAG